MTAQETSPVYPLRLRPVYKDYLWGGDRISRAYRRSVPPGPCAESWEVSDREDGMSVVANGHWAGRDLHAVAAAMGADLLGSTWKGSARFPLLIKLIDSRERLSVQVHPNDQTAARYGGEAKTEMWYILEADPGAGVYSGLHPGVTPERFREALGKQEVEALLQRVPVEAGDAIFTPGGRIHAIDAGCLLLEVQQNSNTTYRLYDWGRVGPDGEPRNLHVEEALRVMDWGAGGSPKVPARRLGYLGINELWEVLRCAYFRMEMMVVQEIWRSAGDARTFQVLFVAEGAVELESEAGKELLSPGTTILLPAALRGYHLRPFGTAKLLRVTLP